MKMANCEKCVKKDVCKGYEAKSMTACEQYVDAEMISMAIEHFRYGATHDIFSEPVTTYVLVPDADLALSIRLSHDAFPRHEVDRMTALKYLHRDALTLDDAPKGYVLICHEGLPLGFVKNLGNRCNSLHPQSRRIRMDINR